jgi:hypothetical protein
MDVRHRSGTILGKGRRMSGLKILLFRPVMLRQEYRSQHLERTRSIGPVSPCGKGLVYCAELLGYVIRGACWIPFSLGVEAQTKPWTDRTL